MSHARKEYQDFRALGPDLYEPMVTLVRPRQKSASKSRCSS